MSKVRYEWTPSQKTFTAVFEMLKAYWKNIAINIFEWQGLDEVSDDLTSEIIEDQLYEHGLASFFKDNNYGYMCLRATPSRRRNVYNRPEYWRVFGVNYAAERNVDNAVLIKNNALYKPTSEIISYYCSKLADIELTKDVHRNAHKTPLVIECDIDTQLSAENVFEQIRSNKPIIFKNRNRQGADVGVKAINTNVPYINDLLEDDYQNYVARILTVLGLDNYIEDKKERVQSAEVESNKEYILESFAASLEQREKAAEAINKMYGLNISVSYRKKTEDKEDLEDEEVIEDEQVHSGD